MEMWFVLAVVVLIALAAPRYGADSRWPPPGEEDPPPPRPGPTPWGDARALARRLLRWAQSTPTDREHRTAAG